MTEKIKLFIIDTDRRVREEGDFEVGDSGKIRYKSGGTENWNPLIGPTTFIERKGWKKYLLFGPRNWNREYYVLRKGEQCIDFNTEHVPTPDGESLKLANASLIAKDIGKNREDTIPWYIWAILGGIVFIILQITGVFA